MADLRVPARFQGPLKQLGTLDEEQRNAILKAFESAPKFASARVLGERVSEAGPFEKDQATDVVWALLSFATQGQIFDSSLEEAARRTARARALDVPEDAQPSLAALLAALAQTEAVQTTIKATDIAGEHEHLFADVRILTDLRPVFDDDIVTEPDGMALSTVIKLSHFTDGEMRSLYVAADLGDLRDLRDSIERALEKAERLRALVADTSIPLFGGEEVDDENT